MQGTFHSLLLVLADLCGDHAVRSAALRLLGVLPTQARVREALQAAVQVLTLTCNRLLYERVKSLILDNIQWAQALLAIVRAARSCGLPPCSVPSDMQENAPLAKTAAADPMKTLLLSCVHRRLSQRRRWRRSSCPSTQAAWQSQSPRASCTRCR